MVAHHRVTLSIKFAGTHLYTWVERGLVRVKGLPRGHCMSTQCPQPGLKPKSLNAEVSLLTLRKLHLHYRYKAPYNVSAISNSLLLILSYQS